MEKYNDASEDSFNTLRDDNMLENGNDSMQETPYEMSNDANEFSNEITEQATDNAKKTIDTYTNKIIVIVGLLFVVLLCIFVSYGLYYVISYSIFNQSKIVIEGTKVPILCNQLNKLSITSFNKTGNGKRRSFTFWIYINDMNKYSGSYKHVFHVGDVDDIRRAGPYVFLDSMENKMYVRFGSVDKDSFGPSYSSVQNLTTAELNSFMQQGIEIPYIPIQRWVHIAVVVNENSNGGSIVAYVDGDIAKIATTGEMNGNGTMLSIRNLDLDKMGDLYVGGSFESTSGPGFSGLLAKVSMYNYDLNNKDVYADYNLGPLNGFLASLGLANYGLRSPIYKIV